MFKNLELALKKARYFLENKERLRLTMNTKGMKVSESTKFSEYGDIIKNHEFLAPSRNITKENS